MDPIKEDRTLQLPAGTPIDRVTVAITPADETAPTAGDCWPSCWSCRPPCLSLEQMQQTIAAAAGNPVDRGDA